MKEGVFDRFEAFHLVELFEALPPYPAPREENQGDEEQSPHDLTRKKCPVGVSLAQMDLPFADDGGPRTAEDQGKRGVESDPLAEEGGHLGEKGGIFGAKEADKVVADRVGQGESGLITGPCLGELIGLRDRAEPPGLGDQKETLQGCQIVGL